MAGRFPLGGTGGLLSGLLVHEGITGQNVTSLDMTFEPSLGIMARKVDKLGLDIRSFREPLKRAIQRVVIPSIRTNFDVGGRPPWIPLADSTVANRGGTDTPLVRTGALKRTMGYFNIWHVDREKALISDLPDRVWYGKVQQAGASFSVRGGGGFNINQAELSKYLSYGGGRLGHGNEEDSSTGEIPPRPFVVIQEEDLVQIEAIFEEWLGERINRAGLGPGGM